MRKITFLLSVAILGFAVSSCAQKGESSLTSTKKVSLKNEIDSVSSALGTDFGGRMNSMGLKEFNNDAFIQAFADAFAGNDPVIDPVAGGQFLNVFFGKLQQKQMEEQQKQMEETQANADVDLKAGQDFLEKNKSKDGVLVTASGLQYKILTEASGKKPAATDKVRVHYHGTLLDGTIFDSSVDRGEPSEFGLNQVIKGWTEGVQLMSVGSKFRFFVPSELAYGPNPRSGPIGPNMVLIFDIELLEIL